MKKKPKKKRTEELTRVTDNELDKVYSAMQRRFKSNPRDSGALRLKKTLAWRYYDRGVRYHLTKKYKKAIADYTIAIELNPNDNEAYTNRGIAYIDLTHEMPSGIADLNKAIKINPKDKIARKALKRINETTANRKTQKQKKK